jgi:dienelactone hydrolase
VGQPQAWREACRDKLSDLLGCRPPAPGSARLVRAREYEGVTVEAWIMAVSADLELPACLLVPLTEAYPRRAVFAVHGHGEIGPCLGLRDDYHHSFALRLAQAGHLVLCPELRGFGALGDMAYSDGSHWLDYWVSQRGSQFTLATDAFMYGATLIGQTVEDLLRWEDWLAAARGVEAVDVAGISYGGDLALTYPPFSARTRRIYASGTLGSFTAVFARCYNAPAHCIPGVLQWMDRSDIAGLNAPRPIRLHYGERDTPGPKNASASYNETVAPALAELRAIYGAFGAEENISLSVTPGAHHEMDIPDLLAFLSDESA